jgi:hypothetical protein
MIRIISKLFAFAVVLTTFLPVAPLRAQTPVTYVSNSGLDTNPCTSAKPCASIYAAYLALPVAGGQVTCLNSPGMYGLGADIDFSITIDCVGVFEVINTPGITLFASNQVTKIRNLTISGISGAPTAIKVTGGGSGTLIIENCVFENFTGSALDIEPTGPFNLVVTNSRISNSAAGALIKPAAGGSVTATFNGVTIADNTGGGLKTDSTNGSVTVDISNSTISKNTGNGLNAVGGAGGPNVLNLSHDVIASNGTAGLQANGVSAAAFVDTTLFDTNATGATASVSGGRLLTYGNNRVVGSIGSGFPSSLPLQ